MDNIVQCFETEHDQFLESMAKPVLILFTPLIKQKVSHYVNVNPSTAPIPLITPKNWA